MSMLLNRSMVTAIWAGAAIGLFTLFGPPLTIATGSLLLLAAIAPPTIMLILSSAPPLTLSEAIAEEIRPIDGSREPVNGLSRRSLPDGR